MPRFLLYIFIIPLIICCSNSENLNTVISDNAASPMSVEAKVDSNSSIAVSSEKAESLEFIEESQIKYKDFEITNAEKGLSVFLNGKRLIFIANTDNYESQKSGNIRLASLLGNNEKQIIYETFTGGNHCCIYQTIVDLSDNKPRVIFRSQDFDLSGVNSKDSLDVFDYENDGIIEITQKDSFLLENCGTISNPVIYVGFKYDQREKKYLPMRNFTTSYKKWIEEMKSSVEESNKLIRSNQRSENLDFCSYYSNIVGVTLGYIYIGREKEGFNYLQNNYLKFELRKDAVGFNENQSKKEIIKIKKDIRKYLAQSKFYKALYNR